MNRKNDSISNDNVIIFEGSNATIGYTARTVTLGKEFDMVEKYITHIKEKYSKLKSKKAAIFIEPQIDTGYPDIVIIEYYTLQEKSWNMDRESLNNTDYKILFYVQLHKNLSIQEICSTLGFSYEVTLNSLLKLDRCSLVHMSTSKNYVRNVVLNTYFRISKIIAVEAKIDKWQEAIRQANNNIWFSSESYIMMNRGSCSEHILETCKQLGIGIILVNGKNETILKSDKRKLPVSYASLQFNEWLLRYLYRKGDNNDH